MRTTILAGAALVASIGLAACNERTGTFDDGEGGEGTYTIDQSGGETRATIKTDDGTAKIESGTSVTANLPFNFKLYPGANVLTSTNVERNGGAGTQVLMQSDASTDEIIAFYLDAAEAAGMETRLDTVAANGRMVAGEGEDGRTFSVSVTPNEEGSTIMLLVAEDMPE